MIFGACTEPPRRCGFGCFSHQQTAHARCLAAGRCGWFSGWLLLGESVDGGRGDAPVAESCTSSYSPLSLLDLVGLSRGKVGTFLSGSVPTEKRMGNCRRAVRVPCTSSGFRQLPRNRRENTLGLHTIPLLRPAGSAPSRCQSHGSRVYMYSIVLRYGPILGLFQTFHATLFWELS